MRQERMELHAMLVTKRISLVLVFLCGILKFNFVLCQNPRTWGISVIPGFSKTSTIGTIDFDPSTFINLKIYEPWQFVPHAEGILTNKRGNYGVVKAVGVSAYDYYDKWEYDPATTATNYVWGKRSFIFLYFALKVNREFTLGKIVVIPETGLSIDYMVRAVYKSESKVGSIEQNLLSQLNRTNFGFSASIKTNVEISDKLDLRIGPYYKILINEYPLPNPIEKRLYFLGLALDLIKSRN